MHVDFAFIRETWLSGTINCLSYVWGESLWLRSPYGALKGSPSQLHRSLSHQISLVSFYYLSSRKEIPRDSLDAC